jgi:hypothetical protein
MTIPLNAYFWVWSYDNLYMYIVVAAALPFS